MFEQLRQICLDSIERFAPGSSIGLGGELTSENAAPSVPVLLGGAVPGYELREFEHPREWVASVGYGPNSDFSVASNNVQAARMRLAEGKRDGERARLE